ncbi:MAG: energy transducer TonB [Acidobacteria bacterium]|nr:energy transducer TonB [Acidobacteriota bacterium]
MRIILFASFLLLLNCSRPTLESRTSKVIDAATDEVLEVELSDVRFKYQPAPDPYPEEAKAAGVSGAVIVLVTVDAEGKVLSSSAIDGPKLLFNVAEKWWSKYIFHPYIKNGVPHKFRFKTVTVFRLRK